MITILFLKRIAKLHSKTTVTNPSIKYNSKTIILNNNHVKIGILIFLFKETT